MKSTKEYSLSRLTAEYIDKVQFGIMIGRSVLCLDPIAVSLEVLQASLASREWHM